MEDKGQEESPQEVQPKAPNPIVVIINKVGDYLHIPLLKIINGTAFFIAIYLTGWFLNAVYGFKFDLPELRSFYLLLAGKQTVEHTVGSIFNSPKGVAPTKQLD